MKLHHRTIKTNGHISGVEAFVKTNDPKEPKKRVAYLAPVCSRGNCKCGGTIVELNKGLIDWKICGKCGKDHSDSSFPKKFVGVA